MRAGRKSKLHIFLLTVLLLLTAWPVFAQNEEPLTLSVEADPECLLSEAGEMTFFRFTVKNNLNEEYVLEDMSLQGDLLAAPKKIADQITIHANDVLEFTLENVTIEEFMFDMDLSFQLTWRTTGYDAEDIDRLHPIVTEHLISAPIRIERFVDPVMTIRCEPDVLMAREGDPIVVTYTLVNDTKFDMTNITLQDAGIPQPSISLEKNVLNAGELMEVKTTFSMGDSAIELHPTAQYTVRGVEAQTAATENLVVEHVEVAFRMEVEKYPATAEGTLFRITLINEGSHPMTDIRITDEIGTQIADGISLNAGKERTISCTIPSAVSAGTVRYISFEATGKDCVGGTVKTKSSAAYELLPFVESDQVRLKLSVSLTRSDQTGDGSNRLKLLFEVRNDSQVPISNAVITEGDYFKSVVNEYTSLSTGTTSFEKEFIVPAGTRSLTFVLTAVDPAQTQYASVPITLDLSPLTAPKPTNPPAIKPGKTVDTTGTIYDTERYIRLFRMAALVAFALTLVFLLLSLIFRVAETNIRRILPKAPSARPFGPRKSAVPITAKENRDPIHDLFGYMQPAKLRYMDRTDRMNALLPEESSGESPSSETDLINSSTGAVPASNITGAVPAVSRITGSFRKEGDITAVPIHKNRTRPVMMSSDDTMPFAPIREGQSEEAAQKEQTDRQPGETTPEDAYAEEGNSVSPRVLEIKPAPRIVPRQKLEIIRIIQP